MITTAAAMSLPVRSSSFCSGVRQSRSGLVVAQAMPRIRAKLGHDGFDLPPMGTLGVLDDHDFFLVRLFPPYRLVVAPRDAGICLRRNSSTRHTIWLTCCKCLLSRDSQGQPCNVISCKGDSI